MPGRLSFRLPGKFTPVLDRSAHISEGGLDYNDSRQLGSVQKMLRAQQMNSQGVKPPPGAPSGGVWTTKLIARPPGIARKAVFVVITLGLGYFCIDSLMSPRRETIVYQAPDGRFFDKAGSIY
tara:strand:+ start:2866 stop:3234 length:369 start_codon:yes stop_codon:yes gene_type:complete